MNFGSKLRLEQIRTSMKFGYQVADMNIVASKLAETLRLFIKEVLYNITAGEVRIERDF